MPPSHPFLTLVPSGISWFRPGAQAFTCASNTGKQKSRTRSFIPSAQYQQRLHTKLNSSFVNKQEWVASSSYKSRNKGLRAMSSHASNSRENNMSGGGQGISIVPEVGTLRRMRREALLQGRSIGLVPTMGALHNGHLQLARMAAQECDEVYISLYINPTQFGVNEDLSSYPRTFEEDLQKLQALNTEIDQINGDGGTVKGRITTIFNPTTDEMYPVGLDHGSHISMSPALTQVLEGKSRPQFFQGVSTVVTKLFNIVQPDKAYFGQKDIQQLVVVQRMINEFHFPVELRCVATERHSDGLAMSSRNVYLGERRRRVATVLRQALSRGLEKFEQGERSREAILGSAAHEAATVLEQQLSLPKEQRVLFEIDYISLTDPVYLKEVEQFDEEAGAILSGAIVMRPLESPQNGEPLGLGNDERPVRLIDNILLGNAQNLGTSKSTGSV